MESTSMIQQPEAQARKWLQLPADVTSMILLKLGAIDILTTAQNVCSSWRKICKDPLMWRVIDMRNSGHVYDMVIDLEILCRTAIDRSCGQLVDINIEYFGTDKLLQHITHSSNQLRRLRIAYCHDITDKGLSKAVSNLPLLEHLEIWMNSFFVETLKTAGKCCPLLKSLKLNREFPRGSGCDEEAIAIAETMPNLHHLQILGNEVTNFGLQAILDDCPDLESLDIRQCFNLDLVGGQLKKDIKNLHLPYDHLDPDVVFSDIGYFSDYEHYADYSENGTDYGEDYGYGHLDYNDSNFFGFGEDYGNCYLDYNDSNFFGFGEDFGYGYPDYSDSVSLGMIDGFWRW